MSQILVIMITIHEGSWYKMVRKHRRAYVAIIKKKKGNVTFRIK